MNPTAVPERAEMDEFETANDRFKQSFGSWFWGGIIAATLLHFAAIAFWPTMTAEDWAIASDELETIEIPPEIEIPPPPEPIARPATPVIADAQIDEDITIAPTTFEDNRPDDLPPPPADADFDISSQPVFVPHTVTPEVRNRSVVERALVQEYPSALRDAGIGGVVLMHFFVDENGRVGNTIIQESSGHALLDQAAERVAQVFEFNPAMNRDERVAVWVSIPIRFTTTR
ncbi:MAG: energy transducer TonB [Gemmatimonadota bacterium]|jgi:periplasmic protein TonB